MSAFHNEDGPEDTGAAPVCGWNGSGTLWVPEHRQADPCPAEVRDRLQAARAVLLQKEQAQRARGLCL